MHLVTKTSQNHCTKSFTIICILYMYIQIISAGHIIQTFSSKNNLKKEKDIRLL